MELLLAQVVEWNVSPEIVSFGGGRFGLRYYSLLWALSFIVGFYLIQAVFRNENRKLEDLDSLFIYMLLGTILGARIGHCLFYDFQYYFIENPVKILYVWEGGLASHGAVIGIMLALWLFVRKRPEYTYMWILDRIVIAVALGGAFIRTGNFFNSEIVGIPTNGNWGVIFLQLGENFPRVPVQLFEAFAYYIIFFLIYRYYWKTKGQFAPGMIFGFFFVSVFGARFLLEFWKVGTMTTGESMLNRGHWLSIPVVLIGLVIWIRAIRKQKAGGGT
jgi:prolipoprotein diacylglyceryl transferase